MTVAVRNTKSWKSLATVNALDALDSCWKHHNEKLAAYAKTIGAPVAELSAWIMKIGAGLKQKPHAIACHLHLMDLRRAAREPPCVLPSDVLRREASLARAKALSAMMPEWPNPAPEPPTDWELSGRREHKRRHGPHKRHEFRNHVDDDDDED
jgi:hypothetical protein